MSVPSRSEPPPRIAQLDESRVEALVLAMAIAPGVYVRNRMFEVFRHPGVRRARTRAALLRGVVRQLGLATDLTVTSVPRGPEPAYVLRYRIASMRMSRVVELSGVELSAVRVLCARAGLACLPAEEADRARVDAVLAHLLDPGAIRVTPG